MNPDDRRRTHLAVGIGAVGALAGTTALAATSAGGPGLAPAGAAPRPADAAVGAAAAVPAADGTYEPCSAMFGLTRKDEASWVLFDVDATTPLTPPVEVGPELQAVLTVHGGVAQPDVECEADIPTWSDQAGWEEFVRVQRNQPSLATVTGRYPYPGGPGYAIPVVDRAYAPDPPNNLLVAPITVSGISVRFVPGSDRFEVVGGSPQDLTNLSPAAGSAAALADVLALDPGYGDTIDQCQNAPGSVDDQAISDAVAALGSVWGIDVDEVFPPASPSSTDRCSALVSAHVAYFDTASKSLTVGATAVVTVAPPTPPTTTTAPTTSTSTTSPSGAATASTVPTGTNDGAAASVVVVPTFTG